MKNYARIKAYQTNAVVYAENVESSYLNIDFDGMEWETEKEYNEWANDVLAPFKGCVNFDEVLEYLRIHLDAFICPIPLF